MPVPTDITAGTISISGSTVTGVGTSFEASDIRQGDLFIWIEGGEGQWSPIVQTVTSNTVLTLAEPWTGPTISGARYRLRYQWDSSRVSAQSRQLIEMLDNGNVLALAGLTGPGVPVFDGPHSMEIRTVESFINGVAYDVQVDTLSDRAGYDGQTAGFAVLVSDVGDGRSAIYSKASNTSGDWTDPAYVTGPVGPASTVEATVETGAPGSTATVDEVPITGGVRLDFTLPAAEGFYNAGVYDIGSAYTTDQVVRHNGSSFIALQAVPAGTSPSSDYPPVDTAFWQVLAARGANGDIDGVTPFWSERLTNDTNASQVRTALDVPSNSDLAGVAETAGIGSALADYVMARKQSFCMAYRNTNTAAIFTNNTLVDVPFDAVSFEFDNWWDVSTPANFYVPNTLPALIGVKITASLFADQPTGTSCELRVTKNGNAAFPGNVLSARSGGAREIQYSSGIIPAQANDIFRLVFFQTSGAAMAVRANFTWLLIEAIFAPE